MPSADASTRKKAARERYLRCKELKSCVVCNRVPPRLGRLKCDGCNAKARAKKPPPLTKEQRQQYNATRNGCNVALGGFRDDPVILQRAARYLVIRGGKTSERQAPLIGTEGA